MSTTPTTDPVAEHAHELAASISHHCASYGQPAKEFLFAEVTKALTAYAADQVAERDARIQELTKLSRALLDELDGEAFGYTGTAEAGVLYEHAPALRAAINASTKLTT